MQPATLPPWLSPWSSGLLYGQRVYKGALRERYRPRDHHRPRLTIYTYNHDTTHTHSILRIGGWGAGGQNGISNSNQLTNTVRPLVGWERYGVERDPPWRLAVPPPQPADLYHPEQFPMKVPPPPAPPGAAPPAAQGGGGEGGGWGSARGWVAGTALLALLVVLARAAENCIDKRFFKGRRRQSEEWPTPNVRATSQQQGACGSGPPGEGTLSTLSVDLPPPYSACAALPPSLRSASPKLADYPEEPPPPYSDCYVEFSNKNGIPSVLIFSRRRNSILNRHEIVGNRSEDEPSTSVARFDDNDAVMLEDIVVERDRTNDDVTVDRNTERNTSERERVTEHNRAESAEPEPSTSYAADFDVPTVIVSETNDNRDNAQVV